MMVKNLTPMGLLQCYTLTHVVVVYKLSNHITFVLVAAVPERGLDWGQTVLG